MPSEEQIALDWEMLVEPTFTFSREEAEKVFVMSRDLEACTRGFAECQADREKPQEPSPSMWGWIAGAVAGAFGAGVLAGTSTRW